MHHVLNYFLETHFYVKMGVPNNNFKISKNYFLSCQADKISASLQGFESVKFTQAFAILIKSDVLLQHAKDQGTILHWVSIDF